MAESNYRTGTSTAGSQFHRDFCARIWFYFDSTQRSGGFQTSLSLYRAMPHTELRSCCLCVTLGKHFYDFIWTWCCFLLLEHLQLSLFLYILLRSLLKLCKTVLENLLFFCPSYIITKFFFSRGSLLTWVFLLGWWVVAREQKIAWCWCVPCGISAETRGKFIWPAVKRNLGRIHRGG